MGSVTPRDGGLTVTVMGDEPDAGRSVTRGKRGEASPITCSFRRFGCENEEGVYGVNK